MATFTPRLSSAGMQGSPYWYNSSYNPYYPTYGLPNCTCYAWGRWYEILGSYPSGLGRGNGGDWWGEVQRYGLYQTGNVPKLGAVMCMAGGPYSGLGHVAVVEKIYSDGTVVLSQSAYTRDPAILNDPARYAKYYFATRQGKASDQYGYSEYIFQGFVYLPEDFDPDIDPDNPPDPEPDVPGDDKLPLKLLLYKKQFYRNQGRLITDVYN